MRSATVTRRSASATRVSRPGSAARATGRRGRGSRSAPRSRARRGRARAGPATHLALFQKYRCGTSSRAGPPCCGESGSPSTSHTTHALPPVTSASGQVGRVAGVREREHVRGGRERARDVEQRVDGDAGERHVELRPRGDAVDVAVVGRPRERVDLVPRPRRRPARRDPRCVNVHVSVESFGRDLGGEHRPAVARCRTGREAVARCAPGARVP